MTKLTLVAGYGAKPRAFEELVRGLQDRLAVALGASFTAYSDEQVHGTIVGLEGERDAGKLVNANFLRLRGERRVMDLEAALEILEQGALPLKIRVGGFAESKHYSFTSQGRHPYERSFSLRGGLATVIGWPASSNGNVRVLDDLRRRFTDANVLHKYHAMDSDVDDDFYVVLGRVDETQIDRQSLADAEAAMREHLGRREPVLLELGRRHFTVVAYEDPALPLGTSRAFSLGDAIVAVDA
jgi:hypothetical protein